MSETLVEAIGALLPIGIGLLLVLKPGPVAEALRRFYSNYPLVRYAGQPQLKSRNSFIVILGVVFILVGMLILLDMILGA